MATSQLDLPIVRLNAAKGTGSTFVGGEVSLNRPKGKFRRSSAAEGCFHHMEHPSVLFNHMVNLPFALNVLFQSMRDITVFLVGSLIKSCVTVLLLDDRIHTFAIH